MVLAKSNVTEWVPGAVLRTSDIYFTANNSEVRTKYHHYFINEEIKHKDVSELTQWLKTKQVSSFGSSG